VKLNSQLQFKGVVSGSMTERTPFTSIKVITVQLWQLNPCFNKAL